MYFLIPPHGNMWHSGPLKKKMVKAPAAAAISVFGFTAIRS